MKTLLLSLFLPGVLFAQSLGDPGFVASLKPAAAGGGPDVFYYTSASDDGSTSLGLTFMEWEDVTIEAGGIVTKLSVKIDSNPNAASAKLALYSGTTLICSGSGALGSPSNAYVEINVDTPTAVSAGAYKIACSFSDSTNVRRLNSAGQGSFALEAYADFPPDPLPSSAGNLDYIILMGVYVD